MTAAETQNAGCSVRISDVRAPPRRRPHDRVEVPAPARETDGSRPDAPGDRPSAQRLESHDAPDGHGKPPRLREDRAHEVPTAHDQGDHGEHEEGGKLAAELRPAL